MENGTFLGCTAPYGYALEDGKLRIIPEEAAVIQNIFAMRLAGFGQETIAKTLNQQEIPTREGTPWYVSKIHYILTNEKYVGDSLLQKKYTANSLTHERKRNTGELPRFYVHDSHQGIVSRECFEIVQKGFAPSNLSRPCEIHTFIHRIQCPDCGRHYRHIHSSGKSYWSCPNQMSGITNCRILRLPELSLKRAVVNLFSKLYTHQDTLLDTSIKLLEEIATRQEQGNAKLYELNTALADLNEKAHTLQRLHNKGFIEDADFREQSDALASQRKKLSDQRAQAIHGSKALETLDKLRELQDQLAALPEIPREFDMDLFDQLVEKVVPISNTELLFKLKCGLELKEVIPQ